MKQNLINEEDSKDAQYPILNNHDQAVIARIRALQEKEIDPEGEYTKVDVQALDGQESTCLCFCNAISALCIPFYFMAACQCLGPKMTRIFEAFGKVIGTRTEPGCYFYPRCCCVRNRDVSTAI